MKYIYNTLQEKLRGLTALSLGIGVIVNKFSAMPLYSS